MPLLLILCGSHASQEYPRIFLDREPKKPLYSLVWYIVINGKYSELKKPMREHVKSTVLWCSTCQLLIYSDMHCSIFAH